MNARPRSESDQRERLAIWAFAAFAFLVRVPLLFGPRQALVSRYSDDAFYVLSIARNIAYGRGITIDGSHLTNGFQPLLAFLYVPLFWLANNAWDAVRLSIILNGLVVALATFAVASVARGLATSNKESSVWHRPAILAAFLWVCSISIFRQTTNGLETALYSLLLLLLLRECLQTERSLWRLGIIAGFTVLARIDAAILVAIVVLFDLFRKQYHRALIEGLLAIVVSLPWWLYNVIYFGSLMPTSGQAETSWPTSMSEQIYRLLQTLSDIALVMVYTPYDLSFSARIISAVLILAGILFVSWKYDLVARLRATKLMRITPYFLFCCVLVVYYTFVFRAPHFIIRYLQPLRIGVLLIWSVALAEMINSYSPESTRKRAITSFIVVALLLCVAIGANRYIVFYDNRDSAEFYDMGMWANAHPTERIGMLQSGIAGFVAPNVVNLDGKVNTEALRAHQQGHLGAYIKREGFTYLADWKPFVEDVAQLCRNDELFFDSVGMMGRIQMMKRRNAPIP